MRSKNRASVSEQLRELIVASGISQYRLAKEAGQYLGNSGINPSKICAFMNGQQGLSLKHVDAIGRVLQIRLESKGVAELRTVQRKRSPRRSGKATA